MKKTIILLLMYIYAWMPAPYYNSQQDAELQKKVLIWIEKKSSEGWEPVGIPFCNGNILMRKLKKEKKHGN